LHFPIAVTESTLSMIGVTPEEQSFADYKKAETRALEILEEMRSVSPRKVDIELALLTALFELHKGSLPPDTVGKIIQTHLETLVPYYRESLDSTPQPDN
jgi:hypothetical protein